MIKPGDILDLRPLDTKFHIKRTAAETGGSSLEMEWELGPKTGGTPVHIHPRATESYEVVEGRLEVYVNGEWSTLKPGDRVTIEPGVPHTFRNASPEVARVHNVHEPALRFGEYFYRLDKLVNSGIVSSSRMSFKAILHLSILMTSYPSEIRPVRPPLALMRVLAIVGRILGYGKAQARWMSEGRSNRPGIANGQN